MAADRARCAPEDREVSAPRHPHHQRLLLLLTRADDLTAQLEDCCSAILELLDQDDPIAFEVRDVLNSIR